MSKQNELIELYITDLKEKLGQEADLELLEKVVTGLGPSIYNLDSSTISPTNKSELVAVKNNFLIKRLGLKEGSDLDDAIESVLENYGTPSQGKYRAVVYYLLTKFFNKEEVFLKKGTGPR